MALIGFDNNLCIDEKTFDICGAVDIRVKLNIEKISEVTTTSLKVGVFLVTSWPDHRLSFLSPFGNLAVCTHSYFGDVAPNPSFLANYTDEDTRTHLSAKFLDIIWHPAIFFQNAIEASHQTVLTDNSFVILYSPPDANTTVYVMTRVSLKLSCPMDLRNYPFDTQKCPITIGILGGIAEHEVSLNWSEDDKPVLPNESVLMRNRKAISVNKNSVSLDEYRLLGWNYNKSITTLFGLSHQPQGQELDTTFLKADLVLRRYYQNYLGQVYVPSVTLVIISWLSYWIDHKAVPARIALCITTILTMQTIASGLKSSLPLVSYYKAIDVYIVICQGFVFVALLEFILTHHLYNKQQSKVDSTADKSTRPSFYGKEKGVKKSRNWAEWGRGIDVLFRYTTLPIFLVFNGIYWYIYISEAEGHFGMADMLEHG